MLLNISVKYLWKYSTLNMQKLYFRCIENTLYKKQGFLIQSGITKKSTHLTFKIIKVEGNENWSIGNPLWIIVMYLIHILKVPKLFRGENIFIFYIIQNWFPIDQFSLHSTLIILKLICMPFFMIQDCMRKPCFL